MKCVKMRFGRTSYDKASAGSKYLQYREWALSRSPSYIYIYVYVYNQKFDFILKKKIQIKMKTCVSTENAINDLFSV